MTKRITEPRKRTRTVQIKFWATPEEKELIEKKMALNNIKGYKKAAKQYKISAICAVGLCDTGTAIAEVRKVNAISEETPLFTMQGGMDKTKLHGINKVMINMLTKGMDSKKDRTEDDERMLYLLKNDQNYVSEENITAFMKWYKQI